MATIGQRAAVVQWGRLHLSRTVAWLIWAVSPCGSVARFSQPKFSAARMALVSRDEQDLGKPDYWIS